MSLTMREVLEPEKGRSGPGMIPESATDKLATFLVAAGVAGRIAGLPPSFVISDGFHKMLMVEWEIERAVGGNPAATNLPWSRSFTEAIYPALWNELKGKNTEQLMAWTGYGKSVTIQHHFVRLAQTPLPPGSVRFFESSGPRFFYTALVSFLYSLMKSLAKAGVDPKNAYKLVNHYGLTTAQSRGLNKAIVDLATPDWVEMGYESLFTLGELAQSGRAQRRQKVKVQQDWREFNAKQAALNRRIAAFEDFERWVKRAATPFEALKKGLGALGDILDFLGKVPGVVWVGAAATAGYFFVVKPVKSLITG